MKIVCHIKKYWKSKEYFVYSLMQNLERKCTENSVMVSDATGICTLFLPSHHEFYWKFWYLILTQKSVVMWKRWPTCDCQSKLYQLTDSQSVSVVADQEQEQDQEVSKWLEKLLFWFSLLSSWHQMLASKNLQLQSARQPTQLQSAVSTDPPPPSLPMWTGWDREISGSSALWGILTALPSAPELPPCSQ